MTTNRIQVGDLLGEVKLYEPHIMRKPMKAEDLVPEEQIIDAAAKTAEDILARNGIKDIAFSDEDTKDVHKKFENHLSELAPNTKPSDYADSTPQGALRFKAIVDEYDHSVIEHADQIRTMVTNKLIELFDAKDQRVQIKAAELLGKIADVGMFVEKQEITYKNQSYDEIEKRLREKLGLIIDGEIMEDSIINKIPGQIIEYDPTNPDTQPLPYTPKITRETLRHIITD
jgi:hypothetical protein